MTQTAEKTVFDDDIEELKTRLERCEDFSTLRAFKLIDSLDVNYLDFRSFESLTERLLTSICFCKGKSIWKIC